MATSTDFPGLDEIIESLKEQKKNDTGPGRRKYPETSRAKAPMVKAGGAFQKTAGMGSKILPAAGAALRSAGRAVPVVGTGLALQPLASDLGETMGEAYRGITMEDAYKEGNPYVKQFADEARAAGRPGVTQSSRTRTREQEIGQQLMSQLKTNQGVDKTDLTPAQEGPSVQFQMPEVETITPDVLDEIPDETAMDTPVQDPQMQAIVEMLTGAPERTPPYEEIPVEHGETIKRLSTSTPREKKPISGFRRFLAAGSGPFDWNRADKQDEELYQMQNQLTDRDRVAAGYATAEVADAKRFNRGLTSQNFESGGMSPQMKFLADLLSSDRKQDRGEGAQMRLGAAGHQQQMERDRANMRGERDTPEATRSKAALKMMSENPDIFTPEQIEAVMGLRPTDAGLQQMLKARGKGNEAQQMIMALVAQQLAQRQGQSALPAAKPAPKKDPEAVRNLQALTK